MQAEVVVIDKRIDRLDALAERFASRIRALYATGAAIAREVRAADLVIGAVLVPGAAAPKLLTRGMLRDMRPGAVVVDIAIDQGGCFETSRATHHAEPVYVESGVVHYCVTNMPGAVPRTATLALSNTTLPHIRALADLGWREALQRDPGLRDGLNVHAGQLRHPAVIEALGRGPGVEPSGLTRRCGVAQPTPDAVANTAAAPGQARCCRGTPTPAAPRFTPAHRPRPEQISGRIGVPDRHPAGSRAMTILRHPLCLGALAAACTWLVPASAHHSHGNYELSEYTHLAGTVTQLHWMNPHTWIYLEVPGGDGESVVWALEGGSPQRAAARRMAAGQRAGRGSHHRALSPPQGRLQRLPAGLCDPAGRRRKRVGLIPVAPGVHRHPRGTAGARRHPLRGALLGLAVSLALPGAVAQQDQRRDIEFQAVEPFAVFDNLYFVGIRAVASYVIETTDGLILIDTLDGFEGFTDRLLENLREVGLDPADIRYVFILQAHRDHYGGARELQSRLDAVFGAAVQDWEIIERDLGGQAPRRGLLLADGTSLTLGDTTVHFEHTPGHTPGTTSLALLGVR